MHSRRPSGGGREFARVGPSARRWRLRGAEGGPGPAQIDLQTTGAELTSSASGVRADRRRASRRERARRRMTRRAGKPRIASPADPAVWRGIDRWVLPGGARRGCSTFDQTSGASRSGARGDRATPSDGIGRAPGRKPKNPWFFPICIEDISKILRPATSANHITLRRPFVLPRGIRPRKVID